MPPAGPVRGGARGEGKRAVADERTPPRRRSDADALFTRDEALSGSPIRRARTLLFLIESRTAYLVAQSQRQMDPLLPEVVARERDLAYLQAFALGREPPLRPTIQDVERFAPQWA